MKLKIYKYFIKKETINFQLQPLSLFIICNKTDKVLNQT